MLCRSAEKKNDMDTPVLRRDQDIPRFKDSRPAQRKAHTVRVEVRFDTAERTFHKEVADALAADPKCSTWIEYEKMLKGIPR